MNEIKEIAHICRSDEKEFMSEIYDTVCNMQNKGLIVELQYSTTDRMYTVLIIGRMPPEFGVLNPLSASMKKRSDAE